PLDEQEEGQRVLSTDWRIEIVDSPIGFAQTSIAVDSTDSPWISYYPPGDLFLSHREDGNWTSELLDTANLGGADQSMAIGPSDEIHVVFHDSDPSALVHLHFNGSVWSREDIVDYGRGEPLLRLDDYGNPHVVYLDPRDISATRVMYALRKNGQWSVEWIAESGPLHMPWGPRVSLDLDSENDPHVSYLDGYENVLKYAYRSNGSWTNQTVDDQGMVGWHNSIALDSDDHPHISYFDKTNHAVKYAYWDGFSWVKEVVDYPGADGGFTSLVIDEDDVPSLVYVNRSEPKESHKVMFASRGKGNWQTEIVDIPGYLPGIASPSLALDSRGNPHVSYWGSANYETRYATKGESQPPEPSRTLTLDIDPDTLNLKSKGRWITAYLSAENASVHDMDVSTILLQDALAPERWDYQDDVLMLKFNRQDFKDTVQVGDSVQVKITGKWEDGTAFEAYDSIRVIAP
ncbi:MAG: hypothetical protein LN417_01190, partial [Candidatus Thermoplasmatota archaeon]|nr:hypothetical protein [Candidatus Thermoplasmatota archaeon]